jgi:peptidoglycan/xylan/chitin deacetylase (PgdA/CDA1 family)
MKNIISSGAIILIYHRVTELPLDPQLLSVSPSHFADQLSVLKKSFNPIGLPELIRGLHSGNVPPKAVIVTFDDGYADNYLEAKPILEYFGIPATVFITAKTYDPDREFWWDELEKHVLLPKILPDKLQLTINGENYHWHQNDSISGNEILSESGQSWNILSDDRPTCRQFLYRSLCGTLRGIDGKARLDALDYLASWSDSDTRVRASHRALGEEEILQLSKGGLIEIGAHTSTHPVLSALPDNYQYEEILQSKLYLEKILGHSIKSFSYPFGTRSDYTQNTVLAVRKAGFSCACSNFSGIVRKSTNIFELPRLLVRDWDKHRFMQQLRNWIYD